MFTPEISENKAYHGSCLIARPQSNMLKKLPKILLGYPQNFLPIMHMLFMLPIMLILCSNMNNIDVKVSLLECSIRVFTIQE